MYLFNETGVYSSSAPLFAQLGWVDLNEYLALDEMYRMFEAFLEGDSWLD